MTLHLDHVVLDPARAFVLPAMVENWEAEKLLHQPSDRIVMTGKLPVVVDLVKSPQALVRKDVIALNSKTQVEAPQTTSQRASPKVKIIIAPAVRGHQCL